MYFRKSFNKRHLVACGYLAGTLCNPVMVLYVAVAPFDIVNIILFKSVSDAAPSVCLSFAARMKKHQEINQSGKVLGQRKKIRKRQNR